MRAAAAWTAPPSRGPTDSLAEQEEEDEAELVFAKGSGQEDLLSLMDELHRVSGVREVSSALTNGSAESKPNP